VGFGSGSPVDSPPESRATNPVWVASRRSTASRGCRAGARERFHSQGLDNGVSSLAPRAVWFVGLCHICRRCSSSDRDTGETPVQRHTGSRGPVASQSIRRSTSTFPDSSLGVHRSPLRRHNRHCVVPRPDRRLDFGSGLPRPDHVPLLPFLPAPAVCYAASRSEDPLVRRSAGLLHPAADHGVRHVSDSLTRPRSRASDPKVVDPKVHPGIVPCGEDPSKRSPPRQPSTMPSPRLVLSDAVAFTGWRSLSPFERRSLACHHAALLCSRPQGFLPPRSPLRSWDVAIPRPLDAPLGFGSTRFPTLPRASRCPARAGHSAWRPEPLRRPLTRT